MRVVDLSIMRQPDERPGVALAIPMEAHGMPRKSAMATLLMMAHCWDKDRDVLLTGSKIATIHVARNEIVKAFLALPRSVQFLVMLDSDMLPPANLISIWVGREDYRFPFISAYCVRKEWPYLPIPSKHAGTIERDGQTVNVYDPVTNLEINSGVVGVDGVGMAAVCIRRDVLEAMEPPYFSFEGGGEDLFFCRKLQALRLPGWKGGVPIAIDTHMQVGHVGEMIAYPSDWITVKPTYLSESGKEEIDIGTKEQLAALVAD